jgi:GntR family transcriptional regulator
VGYGAVLRRTRNNGIPAYQKIQNAIQRRIEAGRLKPGDAVDSERELARLHHVSLMTARHALSTLEKEGIVQRRRGAGTFVAPPKIHFNKLMSFTEQMSGRNLPAHSKVLHFASSEGEDEVAAKLALSSGSRLLKIERLRLGADEAFALETCYLPAAEFPGLNRSKLERSSLFTLLQHEYGILLSYADEEIDATSADAKTAQLLHVGKGMPLLRIRQLLYSTKAKPVVYVVGYYPSDRHSLLVRRYR